MEITSSGYMGTLGLRFQGTQNLAHNTDFARLRTHSACAKAFQLHTRFGRESQIFIFFLLKFLHFWRPERLADGLYKVTSGHWEKEVAGSSDCPGFAATWKWYFPWDEHISPSLLVVPTPTCSSRLFNDKRCRDKPQSWVGYLKLDFQPSLPLALHPGENKGVTASGKASHTQRPVCGSHIKCLGINFLQDVVFCMLATSQWCEEKV